MISWISDADNDENRRSQRGHPCPRNTRGKNGNRLVVITKHATPTAANTTAIPIARRSTLQLSRDQDTADAVLARAMVMRAAAVQPVDSRIDDLRGGRLTRQILNVLIQRVAAGQRGEVKVGASGAVLADHGILPVSFGGGLVNSV